MIIWVALWAHANLPPLSSLECHARADSSLPPRSRKLDEADENDVSVSWADQQQINAFSRFNARLQDVEYDLKAKLEEKEAIDDLSTELELVDEEEEVL